MAESCSSLDCPVTRRAATLIGTCKVEGADLEVCAYTSAEHWDGYTIPAFFRRFGKRIRGYLMMQDDGPVFVPHPDYVQFIQPDGRT